MRGVAPINVLHRCSRGAVGSHAVWAVATGGMRRIAVVDEDFAAIGGRGGGDALARKAGRRQQQASKEGHQERSSVFVHTQFSRTNGHTSPPSSHLTLSLTEIRPE